MTNGFIALEPLWEIAPISAATIDLTSFRDSYDKKLCGAQLQAVLAAIREYKKLGLWIELTTSLIPGLHDDEGELRDIAYFIKAKLGEDVPRHLGRFFPAYKMEHWQETTIHSLLRARDVGCEAGLRHLYMGNVPEEEGSEDTICPGCGAVVIRRWGCRLVDNLLRSGRCPECSQFVMGRWAIGG